MTCSMLKSTVWKFQLIVLLMVSVGCQNNDSSNSVIVPDVVGQSLFDADLQISDAGLILGELAEEYNDTVPVDGVISQSPDASERVSRGSTVDAIISLGPLVTGVIETCMLPGDIPLEMVYIEPGTFMMGAYTGEQAAEGDEFPQHEVTLTQGYWMGKYELTKVQWSAVMGTEHWSGADYVLDDPDSPVPYVSWNLVHTFIDELNLLTGKTFRLPTEAEWEFAARAGTTSSFYWGDDPSYVDGDDYAWWTYNAWSVDEKYGHVVGLKIPNSWGLFDMIGNVWEWCEDTYRFDYYSSSPSIDPTGPPSNSNAVLRGGAVGSAGSYCRIAKRYDFHKGFTSSTVGFRLAM